MYNNGQRPTKMYGGGMTMLRKPMMMGGLAQQNRTTTTGMASKDNPMCAMTEKKKYDMGMNKGGKLNKGLMALKKERPDVVKKMGFKKGGKTTKVAASSLGMNEYGLAAKKVGDKYESYKDGKKTGTFNSLKELEKHQLKLIEIDDKLS